MYHWRSTTSASFHPDEQQQQEEPLLAIQALPPAYYLEPIDSMQDADSTDPLPPAISFSSKSPLMNFIIVIFFFLGATFVGSSLFFLLSGNVQLLRSSCSGFWELFLSRILVSIFLTTLLLFDYYTYWHVLFFLRGKAGSVFFSLYFFMFSVLQYVYYIPKLAADTAEQRTCVNTIQSQSPTGTNILGPLAWTSVSMDTLCFVGHALILLSHFCVSGTRDSCSHT